MRERSSPTSPLLCLWSTVPPGTRDRRSALSERIAERCKQGTQYNSLLRNQNGARHGACRRDRHIFSLQRGMVPATRGVEGPPLDASKSGPRVFLFISPCVKGVLFLALLRSICRARPRVGHGQLQRGGQLPSLTNAPIGQKPGWSYLHEATCKLLSEYSF